jgi:hypothetical protein
LITHGGSLGALATLSRPTLVRLRPLLGSCLAGVVLLSARMTEEGAFPGCPGEGDAVTSGVRALNRLKNRVAAPVARDIDSAVTLSALLAPELHPVTGVEVAQPPR